jgi:transposase
VANLFNLVVDVIFYDTTTASFSIDEADEDTETGAGFRKYGHSKDGTWSPQIVVALTENQSLILQFYSLLCHCHPCYP